MECIFVKSKFSTPERAGLEEAEFLTSESRAL